MEYTAELQRLNKDEEFEYFNLGKIGKNVGAFKPWTVEEHKQFRNVVDTLNDPNDLDTLTAAIPTRNRDQVDVHCRIYRIYCNKQTTSTPNPFMSNLTNNLFKGVLDSIPNELPGIATTAGTLYPPSPSSPISSPSSPSTPSTTTTATTGNTTPGSSTPSTPTSSGKINLHLASHAIPTALQPKLAAANTAQNVSSEDLSNISGTPKSKKDLKILSEPWSNEDQKRLEDALTKYPSTRYSSVSRWQAISKELGISPKTVALRYNQMLDNLIPKKPSVINEESVEDNASKGKRKSTATAKTAAKQTSTKKGKKDTPEKTGTSTTTGLPPLPISPSLSAKLSPQLKSTPQYQQQQQPQQQPPIQKREPTIHNLNFDPKKADSLIQRNSVLIDQIRSDIIYTGSTKIDLLEQYKNNITEALKSTMVWSSDHVEMPPLPVKVNDMIITMMGTIPSKSSLKTWSPLPKTAEDWNLSIPDESLNISTNSEQQQLQ